MPADFRPADLTLDTDALLAGLRPWIECESPTFDPAAVNAMMDLAAAELAAAGAVVTRIPGPPGLGDCVRGDFRIRAGARRAS